MEQKKIDRISELTRIARERSLTSDESAEREALRREYLAAMKQSLLSQIDELSEENE